MNFTITRTIKAQQKLSRSIIAKGKTIAIVPTMGYLHEGHLSLIKQGLELADVVVTTIFVNPAQFAPNEDYARYPRDTRGDLKKIRAAGGQIVFMPKAADMYPDDFQTYVNVEKLTETLEGGVRPGHFKGVATVVAKLFNIVQPDFALFGMKDYQQAMVLRRMTTDLDWPIKYLICPTVREKDGLAMSSRNSYLSPAQRREAVALYKALMAAKKMAQNGQIEVAPIMFEMRRVISQTAPSGKIDYIAFTEMETLKPVTQVVRNMVISLAVRLGPVRLIDNLKI
jgi:pantoate--beta-alanine ligase